MKFILNQFIFYDVLVIVQWSTFLLFAVVKNKVRKKLDAGPHICQYAVNIHDNMFDKYTNFQNQ